MSIFRTGKPQFRLGNVYFWNGKFTAVLSKFRNPADARDAKSACPADFLGVSDARTPVSVAADSTQLQFRTQGVS